MNFHTHFRKYLKTYLFLKALTVGIVLLLMLLYLYPCINVIIYLHFNVLKKFLIQQFLCSTRGFKIREDRKA